MYWFEIHGAVSITFPKSSSRSVSFIRHKYSLYNIQYHMVCYDFCSIDWVRERCGRAGSVSEFIENTRENKADDESRKHAFSGR